VLAAAGDARIVGPIGFKDVRELDWWDEIQFNDTLNVTFVPAQHFSARGLFDRQKSLWGGYMIESRGRRVYFAGDTGYSTHFSDIRNRLGSPDIAMLGIGAYEPRWFMKPIHMNPAEAVCAHRDLGSKQSIGMHFGTFQLTAEAIDQPLSDLKRARAENGIPELTVRLCQRACQPARRLGQVEIVHECLRLSAGIPNERYSGQRHLDPCAFRRNRTRCNFAPRLRRDGRHVGTYGSRTCTRSHCCGA
jgi:Beta-lactamase superfamily domain